MVLCGRVNGGEAFARWLVMEDVTLKHLRTVSKSTPAKASLWEEIVCQISRALAEMLGTMGGAAPMLDFLSGKCEIIEP